MKRISAIGRCVVLVDEVEKMLAGAGSDSSGVTDDIMSVLLKAMAESVSSYWVLTANDVRGLRPELFRAGRLDATWFVDLPHVVEREAIAKLHLARRGVDLVSLVGDGARALAFATDGYSGAEVEQCVKDAKVAAYAGGRDVTTEDLLVAAKGVVPLSATAGEVIADLRKWAKGRAKMASTPLAKSDAGLGSTGRVVDASGLMSRLGVGEVPEGEN
jgi:SpoVK/Ycf46/Vps4 family AAA+-type ATPase